MSFLVGVSRPWKNSLCTPGPALNDSEPLSTLRVHALCLRLRAVCATHLPLTLFTVRPESSSSNVNCTVAALFSVNWNVVPTGGLAAAANLARWLPKRQRRLDWLTFVSVSAV